MTKASGIIFPTSWHTHEDRTENTVEINVFGIDDKGKNILVTVQDFHPYIYIELPTTRKNGAPYNWSTEYSMFEQQLTDWIARTCGKKSIPTSTTLVYQKKLYYAKLREDGTEEKFYFLKCCFPSPTTINNLRRFAFTKAFHYRDEDYILPVHEESSSLVLQLISTAGIKPAEWFSFSGYETTQVSGKKCLDKNNVNVSYVDKEYVVSYPNQGGRSICPLMEPKISAKPIIMCFDIEVNSNNPNKSPNVDHPDDKVFQISIVLCRNGDDESNYERYLLTLNRKKDSSGRNKEITLDSTKLGPDIQVLYYPTEGQLLCGFTDFVQKKQPNIIMGYNIFLFDLPYMKKRAETTCNVLSQFMKFSKIPSIPTVEQEISWKSAAFGDQKFKYLESQGILWVDLFVLVKREYTTLSSYSLKSVSTHFLGEECTKDPLTVKGIFQCYKLFTPASMAIVGKYCVKDSFVTLKLFEHLQQWIGLCEMSNTCNTIPFLLYTQGQQIRMYSQMVKLCLNEYILDSKSYINTSIQGGDDEENDKYTGAYVHDPNPGVYDMVTSFDFSSLYPSAMIAYNLDYTTLVPDTWKINSKGEKEIVKVKNIDDEDCHVFEWTDHRYCVDDTLKRAKRDLRKDCTKCVHRYYRFLKGPVGRIPTILKNLLDARKTTRNELKRIAEEAKVEKDQDKLADLERMMVVLDKRQLSYKICANSCYGATGARKGYLPILPIAMCTTFMGRKSIKKAIEYIKNNYKEQGVHIIYGDTDSVYLNFDKYNTIDTIKELDYHCRQMEEKDLSPLFPKPMKLTYEEHIYWRYLILTKKRYMGLEANIKTGTISDTISKKGVLLARRDNAKFMKDFYSKIIMKGFYKEDYSSVRQTLVDEFNRLLSGGMDPKDLAVNKSVGMEENYKVRALDKDDGKAIKRLESLSIYLPKNGVNNSGVNLNILRYFVESGMVKSIEQERIDYPTEWAIAQEYRLLCLPPQVQLAIRMRSRGKRVDHGERLSYVMLQPTDGGKYTKVYQKLEHIDYYLEHSQSLHIDYFYYLNLFIKPFEEVLSACYGQKDPTKGPTKGPTSVDMEIDQQAEGTTEPTCVCPLLSDCNCSIIKASMKAIYIGKTKMNIAQGVKKVKEDYKEMYYTDDFKKMVKVRMNYAQVLKELEELSCPVIVKKHL